MERPHYFPYRVYSNPDVLALKPMVQGDEFELAQGDCICAEDCPDECFLVLSGALASFVCTADTRTLSAFYLPGSIFLELSALAHHEASLEYHALERCILSRISASNLKSAMMENGSIFDHVMRSICHKMYSAREQQRGAKLLDVRERVYLLLLGFAKDRGRAADDGWISIDWKLTQQDMGNMLSVNRVTVNTALKELSDQGLVRKFHRYYEIRDVAGLLDTVE